MGFFRSIGRKITKEIKRVDDNIKDVIRNPTEVLLPAVGYTVLGPVGAVAGAIAHNKVENVGRNITDKVGFTTPASVKEQEGRTKALNLQIEQANALQGVEKWNRYKSVFLPHVARYIKSTTGYNPITGAIDVGLNAATRNSALGAVNADLNKQMDVRNLGNMGIRNIADAASMYSRAMQGANNALELDSTSKLLEALNIGRGQRVQATNATNAALNIANREYENRMNAAMNRDATIFNSLGSAIALGANSLDKYLNKK